MRASASVGRRSERFHRAALEVGGGVPEVVAVTRREDSLLASVYRGVLSLPDASAGWMAASSGGESHFASSFPSA
jgi:hypothetical protein